ncbi:MAG TPA: hypothetical protein VGM05_24150 [Planctomycetaceae bacterium]|jgi:macrodomain Ter protein organizer (MatP/YcbG family)
MKPHAGEALISRGSGQVGIAVDDREAGDSSVDFLLEARVDTDWVKLKFETEFNGEVLQNLKKAVYGAGQRGKRWFSGGGELSARQASMILDYLVLVELLIQCRSDLAEHRSDLFDCRDQLLMQISRYTEGQPERATSMVQAIVARITRQLARA